MRFERRCVSQTQVTVSGPGTVLGGCTQCGRWLLRCSPARVLCDLLLQAPCPWTVVPCCLLRVPVRPARRVLRIVACGARATRVPARQRVSGVLWRVPTGFLFSFWDPDPDPVPDLLRFAI